MALMGKPSTAHEFDKSVCIHCGMYENIVKEFTHVCTMERELATDGCWLKSIRGGVTSQTT